METVSINTAKAGKMYLLYVPDDVAKDIYMSVDDGYGGTVSVTIDGGTYEALCKHDVYADGKPKYWELQIPNTPSYPEVDDENLRAVLLEDIKKFLAPAE